jgi:uncharacterized protein YxjI
MSSEFFKHNNYFIDEKVQFLQFENSYKIYSENGLQLGHISQKLSFGQKLLRLLVNKNMMPFYLEIRNFHEGLEASISRGWTFFMSKIIIKDANDKQIGTVQQKFHFIKPSFLIYNANDELIAEIKGDWKAWNFTINHASGSEIGSISKKWAGAMKEIFTNADKYIVQINPSFQNTEEKIVILSAAITIDMVLKERS